MVKIKRHDHEGKENIRMSAVTLPYHLKSLIQESHKNQERNIKLSLFGISEEKMSQ